MVFVLMVDDDRPISVELWIPDTEKDKALSEAAVKLMDTSKSIMHEAHLAIDAAYD